MAKFRGTVDEFLDYCAGVDPDFLVIEQKYIEIIAKEFSVSEELAAYCLLEWKKKKTSESIDRLMEQGLIEISGYNEQGEPLYSISKKGRKFIEEP